MKKLILIPSLLLMAGCARNMTSTDVKGQISVAVTSNAKATSYQDWHISDTNSDAIMADLTKKYFNKQVTEKDICQAFEEVPTSDLVVFENHIRTDESAFILKSCQAALKQKLDKYWKAELIKIDSRGEKPSMAPAPKGSDNSVRRFDEVVYVEKDLDNGNNYFVYGDLKKGQVALTFDDGPSGLYTELVLKALADANVKATFFTKGNNVRQNPHLLKEVAAEGHSIGSHSNTHLCLGNRIPKGRSKSVCESENSKIGKHELTFEQAAKDIMSGHQAIKDVLGWVHPFFRFPYGESSPALKKFLKDSGTGEFLWSVDSNDWRAKIEVSGKVVDYTPKMMIDDIVSQLKAKGYGIMLQHDIQAKTAHSLPAVLNRLYDEGYQPVVFIPKDNEVSKRVSHLLGE